MAIKTGSLSKDELLAVWRGSVDADYANALKTAGDGNGYEVPSQAAEVWARISKAVEVSTQALYILPWSGQTEEPAGGDRKATVTLTFERTRLLERPIVLGANLIFAEEITVDFGENGGIPIRTGRRYMLTEDLVFHPGERGPITVLAEAERPGWGFNNPLPGTINRLSQPGANFGNNLGTVAATNEDPSLPGPYSRTTFIAENQPDMPVPEHVGQYMVFVDGANLGKIARVITFINPNAVEDEGSGAILEQLVSFTGTITGTFTIGEVVEFGALGFGRVFGVSGTKMTCAVLNGAPDVTITGVESGATMTGASIIYGPDTFADEAPSAGIGGATWRVLEWANDLGITVTNVASPSGGRIGVLDAVGDERDIKRGQGESDDSYRIRVATVADTVAPNAIRRALNRALGDIPWAFLEVGRPGFPGFFFDAEDAYDYDTIAFEGTATGTFVFQEPIVLEHATTGIITMRGWFGRLDGGDTVVFIRRSGTLPASLTGLRIRGETSGATLTAMTSGTPSPTLEDKRYNVWLDYEQFRAFFLVELPGLSVGEFGFAYDALSPYDSLGSTLAFYDGFPADARRIYRSVVRAMNDVRAGGVGFQIVKTPTIEDVATG